MKLTLQEAYERATKGPLEADAYGDNGVCFHEGNRARVSRNVAPTAEDQEGSSETVAEVWPTAGDQDRYDAAILAHAFNVLPEVVAMLEWLTGFHQDGDGKCIIDAEPIKQAKALLAKASTVEVPE